MRPPHGVLVVDKPSGVSSAQAVATVKRALRAERAGHGGTLDPLATGVLPICLGAGTKLSQYLLAEDKTYEAEAILGLETETLNRTGRVVREADPSGVTREALLVALAAHVGDSLQVPPMYSAIKQGGLELYKRARRGEEVEREARAIRIDRLELLDFTPPRFRFVMDCGKGTYVRSLIADVGTALGCGAALAELRRTQCGRFRVADAVTLDAVRAPGFDLAAKLIAVTAITELPSFSVPPELLMKVRHAVQLPVESIGGGALPARFQLVDVQGRLVAVAHTEGGRLVFDRVFPELLT